jgi:hypothetical protein
LDVVNDKENFQSVFNLETPHSIEDNNILEKPLIDYIETWFPSIVGQELPSYFGHIQLNITSVYLGHAFHSLIAALTFFPILNSIP